MPVGPGDDAAVLQFGTGRVVATTDTMSEGQDFQLGWWQDPRRAAHSVGVKAAAQNLSDISAMGADPVALLVSLTLPAETSLGWARDLMAGVAQACTAPGTDQCLIAGGDLGLGNLVSVTITALGSLTGSRALLRSGAQAGDVVAVCGPLGRAAAGLWMLEGQQLHAEDPTGAALACREAQQRPAPDLTAGKRALDAGATAGMDVSDGLLRDAQRLATASGVGLRLDEDALAEDVSVLEGLSAEHARDWVLCGGEDYALLCTFSPSRSSGASRTEELPRGFRRIGQVLDGAPEISIGDPVFPPTVAAGWDSLR